MDISANFQLRLFSATRYSREDIGFSFFSRGGSNTGRPSSEQIWSLTIFSRSIVSPSTWSLRPVSKSTLLMMRWEWT